MKKSHKSAIRRDRRKAKASNWKRSGKNKMGVVAHGPNGAIEKVLGFRGPGNFITPPEILRLTPKPMRHFWEELNPKLCAPQEKTGEGK